MESESRRLTVNIELKKDMICKGADIGGALRRLAEELDGLRLAHFLGVTIKTREGKIIGSGCVREDPAS